MDKKQPDRGGAPNRKSDPTEAPSKGKKEDGPKQGAGPQYGDSKRQVPSYGDTEQGDSRRVPKGKAEAGPDDEEVRR